MGNRNGFQKDTTLYWTSDIGSLKQLNEKFLKNQSINQILEGITLETPQYPELLKTSFIILIKTSIFPSLKLRDAKDLVSPFKTTAKAEFLIKSADQEIKALKDFGGMVGFYNTHNDLFIKMTNEPVAIDAGKYKIIYDTMSTIAHKTLELAEKSTKRALQDLTELLNKMIPFFQEDDQAALLAKLYAIETDRKRKKKSEDLINPVIVQKKNPTVETAKILETATESLEPLWGLFGFTEQDGEYKEAFLSSSPEEKEAEIKDALLAIPRSGSVMNASATPKSLGINQTQFDTLSAETDFSKLSVQQREAYVYGTLEIKFHSKPLPLQQPDHTVPDLMGRIENYGQALVEGTQAIGIQLYNNAKSAALASRLQGVMGHLYATVYNAETLDR